MGSTRSRSPDSESDLIILLFDIDGTLIDAGGAGSRAIDRAFSSLYGISGAMTNIVPDGMMDPAILDSCYAKCLGIDCMPQAERDLVMSLYLDFLQEEVTNSNNFEVLPGVHEVVEKLLNNPQIVIGLGTGNIRAAARIKLWRAQLWDRFKFGGFGEDGPTRANMLKVGVNRANRLLGIKANNTRVFVLGDTPADLQAANEAGYSCITVATGRFSADKLLKGNPHRHLEDLTDFSGLMQALEIGSEVQKNGHRFGQKNR